MAEELTFQQTFGQGRTIYRDKRLVTTRAVEMNGFGHQLFAGSTFALNQHRSVCRGNFAYLFENIANGLAFADEISKAILGFHGLAQTPILFDNLEYGDGFFNINRQALVVEGFQNIAVGPFLHGLHGLINGPVSSHHDHRQIRIQRLNVFKQINAIHCGHFHVGKNQIQVG